MKALTVAGWRRLLARYEELMNLLLNEELDPCERESLFALHDAIRTRASGAGNDQKSS